MTKKLSNEELVARIRAGQNIKDNMQQLYNQNLPLIRQFIRPFLGYEDEADLLQESYIGLWQAVRHYESSECVRFMTYSKYWIQQEVRRYLENSGSLIRIPSHKKQQGIQYKRLLQEYEREYGRPPSDLEAAEDLGVSLDELTKIRMSMQGVSLERVRQIKADGLRRLRRGKALRELEQKCEIAEADIFRGGFSRFKHTGLSSVEKIILRLDELEEQYKTGVM